MRILVVNVGSSTLKLRVVEGGDLDGQVDLDPWAADDDEALASALAELGSVDAVGHRIVHGGPDLAAAVPVDDDLCEKLAELTLLAPLHQRRALAALAVARRERPGVPHVACFDTAFHAGLPPAARTYALPAEWRRRWPLRRFGFHGLSHAWAARRGPEVAGGAPARRIVSCHLGAGASLCAVLDGRSVDTTMGFTPLEGLVMATRSGSVDPGLVLWLLAHTELDAEAVAEGLERSGGLAGLSQTSGDMREVLAARAGGDEAAALALAVHTHRLRREVAAMAAALGGLDLVVFTGGVGEHSPEVRAEAAAGLAFLGVRLDAEANRRAEGDADLTVPGAPAGAVVVTAREDLEIARQVRARLDGGIVAYP
ncbi:MAG TPA: acetate/propionate family kinase [Acidimicrobiales bacterium]|nr:acetate/propionate family kinase [Acidimicrobiales bacterium]